MFDLGFIWWRNGDFFLIFAKANYQNNLLMLCKNLRSATKNSHTGLFFRPRGVALVKSPFIYKQKGKGHEHKGSYPFPWRRNGDLNPRYAYDVYTISNRAPSTTQPFLQSNTIRQYALPSTLKVYNILYSFVNHFFKLFTFFDIVKKINQKK